MGTEEHLRNLMQLYTADNLLIYYDDFYSELQNIINMGEDDEEFKTNELSAQRKQTLEFHWGHNHDFGRFKMNGQMGDRHIHILTRFIDDYNLPLDLTGANVLDVGVWTGGTTLLLAAMGADVWGIEEVRKYAVCANYLVNSFISSKRNVGVSHISLFDLINNDRYDNLFDIIIFPGVLYHLSDPILALRILFNMLRDGGELYIETMTMDMDTTTPLFEYYGTKKDGWNWFAPNMPALNHMLFDVGFSPHRASHWGNNRLISKATREIWKPMIKSGLSRRIR